jgi:hypothetical protein
LAIFDEASAIDRVIWQTVMPITTGRDAEVVWCVFGNPLHPEGQFKDCFDDDHWITRHVDSRIGHHDGEAQLSELAERQRVEGAAMRAGVHALSFGSSRISSLELSDDDALAWTFASEHSTLPASPEWGRGDHLVQREYNPFTNDWIHGRPEPAPRVYAPGWAQLREED